MEGTRSYRSVYTFFVLIMLFAAMVGCRNYPDQAEELSHADAISRLSDLFQEDDCVLVSKELSDGDGDRKDEKKSYEAWELIGADMTVSSAPEYLTLKWDCGKLKAKGVPIDDLETFEFRCSIAASDGDKAYMIWRGEVAPKNGKFMMDYKLVEGKAYNIHVYVRFKDHKGPDDTELLRRFIDSCDSDFGIEYIDLNNAKDRELWYVGNKNGKTLSFGDSGIIGNYGYDYRKGGMGFNPDALVAKAWLNLYPLFMADPAAIVVLKPEKKDGVIYQGTEVEVYTQTYLEEIAFSHTETSKWDVNDMLSLGDGSKAGGKISSAIQKSSGKYEEDFKMTGYISGADGGDMTGGIFSLSKDKIGGLNDPETEAIKAAIMFGASAVGSCLDLATTTSIESSSSGIKSMGNSIVGTVEETIYVKEEALNSTYYSLAKLRPYLLTEFFNDVNNIGVKMSPEALFDKYGTHVLLHIHMGGKLNLSFRSNNFSGASQSETKTKVENIVNSSEGAKGNSSSDFLRDTYFNVESWGGRGANTTVTDISAFNPIRAAWTNSVPSNPVFVNAPKLLSEQGAGSMSGIWNFAVDSDRKDEIYSAFLVYCLDNAIDDIELINSTPRYLMDLVVFRLPDLDGRNISDEPSYSRVAYEMEKYLFDGGFKSAFCRDDVYDAEGNLTDDVTYSKVFTDASGNPICFGDGVYGFGLYTPQPTKALRDVAVTVSTDTSFSVHANQLVSKYGLKDATIDSDAKKVIEGDGVTWWMSECDNADDGKYYNGKFRLWKTREAKSKNPVTNVNLCVEKGSASAGWEYLLDANYDNVFVNDVALAVKRDNVV